MCSQKFKMGRSWYVMHISTSFSCLEGELLWVSLHFYSKNWAFTKYLSELKENKNKNMLDITCHESKKVKPRHIFTTTDITNHGLFHALGLLQVQIPQRAKLICYMLSYVDAKFTVHLANRTILLWCLHSVLRWHSL